MVNKRLLNTKTVVMMALIAVLIAGALVGCSGAVPTSATPGGGSEGGEASHSESGGEGSEAGESGSGAGGRRIWCVDSAAWTCYNRNSLIHQSDRHNCLIKDGGPFRRVDSAPVTLTQP